jgi:hypothetical protein
MRLRVITLDCLVAYTRGGRDALEYEESEGHLHLFMIRRLEEIGMESAHEISAYVCGFMSKHTAK